jgi:hypothetical protein
MSNKDDLPREKRWKDMYIRSTKVVRAKQLGFDYPRTTEKQLTQEEEGEVEKIADRLKGNIRSFSRAQPERAQTPVTPFQLTIFDGQM